MRPLVKTLGTLVIILAVVVGVYYVYRARTAKQEGREYSVSDLPGDLAKDLQSLFGSSKPARGDTGPSTPGESKEPEEVGAEPRLTPYQQANAHYMAARYADAVPLLRQALSEPGSTGTRPAELLARTRLFMLLLDDIRPGSALAGAGVGYLTMPGGHRMLVTIEEETTDDIAFEAKGGIRSRIKRSELKSAEIARTRPEKVRFYEREYRVRHDEGRTSGDFLELGRFSAETGLADHVTYCLERAIDAPGDGVEKVLAEHYEAGGRKRKKLVKDLFRRFYPRSEILEDVFIPDATASSDEEGRDPGTPASGIGGVRDKIPRGGAGGEIEKLLAKAAEHRKEGDRYYKLAFKGGAKASEHKDKALKAYQTAQALYEQVENRWNVGLDRTFKDIQTRVYDLLKSIR